MSDDALELRKAVYTALNANGTLTAMASIYDGVPQDTAPPYVDLGEADVDDWGTKTFDGGDHFLTLHVWSSYRGQKEAWDIIEQIRSTLHNASLSVTGHALVLIRHSASRVFRDINGQFFHGVTEFRALTQDT